MLPSYRRDFSLVCDRAAGGKTLFVTIPMCLWSPSVLPHPEGSTLRNSQTEVWHTSLQYLFFNLYVEIYPSQDISFSTAISRCQGIQSSLGSMWEMVLTQGLHRKDAVEGTFPSDNLVATKQQKSTEWIGECCWCDLWWALVTTAPRPWTCLCSQQGFLAWEQSLGGHHLLQAFTQLHWAGTKLREAMKRVQGT